MSSCPDLTADISQSTFSKARNIFKLLFQANRRAFDFELNELQDIQNFFNKVLADLSSQVGPVGDGFMVVPNGVANQLVIRAGFFVTRDRRVLYLAEDYTLTGLTTPTSAREDFVYINVPEVEKTPDDYPDLLRPHDDAVGAFRLAYDIRPNIHERYRPPFARDCIEMVHLARLDRTPGQAIITQGEITDDRWAHSGCYHVVPTDGSGAGRVTAGTGLTVNVEAAQGFVWGNAFSVGASTLTLPDNDISNIYIDAPPQSALRVNDPDRPYAPVAWEATVTTSGGVVIDIEDKRQFAPGGVVGYILDQLQESVSSTGLLGVTAANLSAGTPTHTVEVPSTSTYASYEVHAEVDGGGTSSIGTGMLNFTTGKVTGMHHGANFASAQLNAANILNAVVAKANTTTELTITAYSGAGNNLTFTLTGAGSPTAFVLVKFF